MSVTYLVGDWKESSSNKKKRGLKGATEEAIRNAEADYHTPFSEFFGVWYSETNLSCQQSVSIPPIFIFRICRQKKSPQSSSVSLFSQRNNLVQIWRSVVAFCSLQVCMISFPFWKCDNSIINEAPVGDSLAGAGGWKPLFQDKISRFVNWILWRINFD